MLGVGMCYSCTRMRSGVGDGQPTCEAFPAGIPEQITDGGFDHTEPFPGDHGVRFEAEESVDVERLQRSLAKWREQIGA